ncbi:MAG: tail protein [Phage 65_10]|nr:MAG: tail protein [Phage 65_10]
MTTDIRVVISGDSSNAETALKRVEDLVGTLESAGSSRGATGVKAVDTGLQGVARSSRAATEQMRNLNYQITDIVTGLATGQNPFYVLLQQGGQLKDVFGGVLPALRAIGSLFTLTRVAIGGVVGALGLLAFGLIQGRQEAKELDTTLRLSGAGAAVTAGQYRQLVSALADRNKLSVGDLRETAVNLIGTQEFGGALFKPALEAAAAYQKASGQTGEESAKVFSGLTQDVTGWAAKANKSFNFVTAAQLDHIRELQAQRKYTEAATEALGLFAANMQTKATPELGYLDRALNATARGWSAFWQSVKNLGATESPEEKIVSLREKIENVQASLAKNRQSGAGKFSLGLETALKSELASAQESLTATEEVLRLQSRSRTKSAAEQKAEQEKIDADSAARAQARIAVERVAIQNQLADQLAYFDHIQRVNEEGYREGSSRAEKGYSDGAQTFAEYQKNLTGIQLVEIDKRETAAKREAASSLSQKGLEPEARAQIALELEGKLKALQAARVKVGDDADAARFENAQAVQAVLNRVPNQQANLSAQTYENLKTQNKSLTADLIRDDRDRGMARIQIEEDQIRARSDISDEFGVQQKAFEDELAKWRVNREKQLNNELKPLWQQNLEDWRNLEKLKRDATNESLDGILRNSEDVFVQLVTTGKLSFRTLVNDFLATQAKLAFRQLVGNVGNSAGSVLGDLFQAGVNWFSSGQASSIGGGRAYGGDVNRGSLHPVNETGASEVLTQNGRDYLMVGANSGRVTKAATGTNIAVSMPLTLHIDARSDQAQIAQITSAAVQEGQRQTIEQLRAARVIA